MYSQQGYPQYNNAGPSGPQVVYGVLQQPQPQQPVYAGPAPYPSAPVYYASGPQPVVYAPRPDAVYVPTPGPQPQSQAQVIRVGYLRSASSAMTRHRRPLRILSGIFVVAIIAYGIYQVVTIWGHSTETN